ncbi:hypothetical protein [Blautia producta]
MYERYNDSEGLLLYWTYHKNLQDSSLIPLPKVIRYGVTVTLRELNRYG